MSEYDQIGEKKICRVLLRHGGAGQEELQFRRLWVVRGYLAPEFFGVIVIPSYQRMAMRNGDKHRELMEALMPGGLGVPNDLVFAAHGMHRNQGGGVVSLEVPELIVLDGHQRVDAATERIGRGEQCQSLGCKIIIDPTLAEQMNMFYQINRKQTPVAGQVHLRNSSETTAIRDLLSMAAETVWFPDVQTDQQRQRQELITLHMLLEVAVLLHGYKTNLSQEEILDALKELTDLVGAKVIVANVKKFFEVLHRCFGTKVESEDGDETKAYFKREGKYEQIIYRIDLLRGLALLFAGWNEFWDVRTRKLLLVRAPQVKKLRGISKRSVEEALGRSGSTVGSYRNFLHRIESSHDESPLTRRIAPWQGNSNDEAGE